MATYRYIFIKVGINSQQKYVNDVQQPATITGLTVANMVIRGDPTCIPVLTSVQLIAEKNCRLDCDGCLMASLCTTLLRLALLYVVFNSVAALMRNAKKIEKFKGFINNLWIIK